ncbi:MAG: RNHCP domain-containing protein [Oscillospiraceae bacterium]|nr:RNHCP domain-containing protein [Oscillospiraceae bacterium]
METKKFIKNDSGFICVNCGKSVGTLKYTSRNHCPYCLFSLHVDINPGDRDNTCKGKLEPVLTEPSPDIKKGYIIIFKCKKCGEKVRNRAANDDNTALLIKLTNPDNYKNKK